MKRCEKCGVQFSGDLDRCPLCQAELSGDASPAVFPRNEVRKSGAIALAVLALSLIHICPQGSRRYRRPLSADRRQLQPQAQPALAFALFQARVQRAAHLPDQRARDGQPQARPLARARRVGGVEAVSYTHLPEAPSTPR